MNVYQVVVLAVVLLVFGYAILAFAETHDDLVDEDCDFDGYPLPHAQDVLFNPRAEDFEWELDFLVVQGQQMYGLQDGESARFREFARSRVGCYVIDIFRAFYRAQLGIKED
jgi:hypothetical protein